LPHFSVQQPTTYISKQNITEWDSNWLPTVRSLQTRYLLGTLHLRLFESVPAASAPYTHQQRQLDITANKLIGGDSRKSWQKMTKKTRQTFVKITSKSRQNHDKDMASNHGPEDHKTVYKTHHLATSIDDHHYILWKVFICGILSLRSIKIHISTMTSHSHIEPENNKEHGLW